MDSLKELDLGYNSIIDFAPTKELVGLETLRVTDKPGDEDKR